MTPRPPVRPPARPLPLLDVPWLRSAETRTLLAALDGEGYFVGGCVRNALLGLSGTDIDIATPLLPQEVTDRLVRAGLKAVPTGIEHGTVTAVVAGRPFEVTTFRADVETDGRRAVVRFSTDMAEDAGRRDFTMNALYADAEGRVIDPLGGLPDLEARRVRFIGAAEARIREDYLRILRFFRFSAWYGAGLDGPGLAACAALRGGIAGLARERIGTEMRKLLAAPDPVAAVGAMETAGVLCACLPGASAAPLGRLVAGERASGAAPDWLRRLVAIGGDTPGSALRLSRAEARAHVTLAALVAAGEPPALAAEAAGPDLARSAALIRAAAEGTLPPPDLDAALARGAQAVFPLAAEDLLAAGMRPGPGLGRALATARAAWRASDFALDKDALLEVAQWNSQED